METTNHLTWHLCEACERTSGSPVARWMDILSTRVPEIAVSAAAAVGVTEARVRVGSAQMDVQDYGARTGASPAHPGQRWGHVTFDQARDLLGALMHVAAMATPGLSPEGWPCAVCGRSHDLPYRKEPDGTAHGWEYTAEGWVCEECRLRDARARTDDLAAGLSMTAQQVADYHCWAALGSEGSPPAGVAGYVRWEPAKMSMNYHPVERAAEQVQSWSYLSVQARERMRGEAQAYRRLREKEAAERAARRPEPWLPSSR